MSGTKVVLERGRRRVFATAADWPGWCRSGRSDEEALEALAEVAGRYAEVLTLGGVRLPASAASGLEVVEEVPGTATTDFGAPGTVAGVDHRPMPAADRRRVVAILAACWQKLSLVGASAPEELRKGPRGGGRDRDQIFEHVLGGELAYGRKIGVRRERPELTTPEVIERFRGEILAVLGGGHPPDEPGPNPWPLRYAANRIAWHVLDHAWEIEDKA